METQNHVDTHTHMNDNPKRGQKMPFSSIQILLSPLRLEILFLFRCLRQIPAEAGNEELRQEHEKTNQVATKSENTTVLQ